MSISSDFLFFLPVRVSIAHMRTTVKKHKIFFVLESVIIYTSPKFFLLCAVDVTYLATRACDVHLAFRWKSAFQEAAVNL